jgi:hypothetical protein
MRAAEPEPEPEPAPEPVFEPAPRPEEPEPVPEPEPEPVFEPAYAVSDHPWPPPLKSEPRTREPWETWVHQQKGFESWGFKTYELPPSDEEVFTAVSKKDKKKKGKRDEIKRTTSVVEEVPVEEATPVTIMERVEGEIKSPEVVEQERDPWVFWGVTAEKKSPRTSFGV